MKRGRCITKLERWTRRKLVLRAADSSTQIVVRGWRGL
jgi:hypothetical protein